MAETDGGITLFEDVENLKKAVKSLKSKHNKIANQVEQLDLIGFQQQISSLDDKVNKLSEQLSNDKIGKLEAMLLETRRYVARKSIEDLRLFLENRLAIDLPHNSTVIYQKAHEFLMVESAKAQQVVIHSSAPISVAELFEKNCHAFFTSNSLSGFQT
jgi:hypothetical protein